MREMLESPAQPSLPASLQVLRQLTSGTLCLSVVFEDRPEGSASPSVPVLELHAGNFSCSYTEGDPDDERCAGAPAEVADLPSGVSVLWLRTKRLAFGEAYRASLRWAPTAFTRQASTSLKSSAVF